MPELRNPANPVGRHVGRLEPRLTLPADWKAYVYRGTNQPDKCGTEPGYQQHRTNQERVCADCQQAHARHNETERQRAQRKRDRNKENR